MSAFALKLIACFCMLVDHVAAVFYVELSQVYPELPFIMRCIGRVAFPLFAFGITQGVVHTKDISRYIKRMLIVALVSQLPYMLMCGICNASGYAITIGGHQILLYKSFSVIVTLLIGLFACICYEQANPFLLALSIGGACLINSVFSMDYGLWGVLFIFALYLARRNKPAIALIYVIFAVSHYFNMEFSIASSAWYNVMGFMCSLIFIMLYNGKKGVKSSRLFYIFYPMHMAILVAVYFYMHGIF